MSLESGRTIGAIDAGQHRMAPSVRDAEERERNRHPINAEIEKKFSAADLENEVKKIHLMGEDGLYFLPGTGFHVTTEVNNLLRNITSGVSLENAFKQVEQNVQGFKIEYLVEGPVFPIVLEEKQYEGGTRLAGKLYGGGLWLDATSEDERDGVVKKIVEKLEPEIIRGKAGDLFVMASPKGWSGYQLREDVLEKENKEDIASGKAKRVRYPDAQIYCIKIQNDGSVRGFTLKSNMSLAQTEELMKSLGVPEEILEEDLDDKSRIKRIISTAGKISSEKAESIEDIANLIPQITGSDILYHDTAGKPHTKSEMMRLLKDPDHLWTLDETLAGLMDVWKEYVVKRLHEMDGNTEQDLRISLGYIVMQLMHKMRPPVAKKDMGAGSVYKTTDRYRPVFNPKETLEEMQKIGGCAGGGNSIKVDSLTPRTGILGNEDEYGSLTFECPDCHRVNTRQKGKLLSRCRYMDCQSTKVGCDTAK